jgi:hypothetical protein
MPPLIKMSFTKARRLARRAGFKSVADFNRRASSLGIPVDPTRKYEPEFKTWQDFLNIPHRATARGRLFLSFSNAKKFVHEHGITSGKQYIEFRRQNADAPIPWTPRQVYKEWKGFPDFLGVKVRSKARKTKSFSKGRS